MGQDESGNFVFDFRPDPKVVDATITQEFDNTNTTSLLRKFRAAKIESRDDKRHLQTESSQRLYNPVICIKEGDTIFFNVRSKKLQYPRYFKDSILNTNQNFDYGPFTKLEEMITI